MTNCLSDDIKADSLSNFALNYYSSTRSPFIYPIENIVMVHQDHPVRHRFME